VVKVWFGLGLENSEGALGLQRSDIQAHSTEFGLLRHVICILGCLGTRSHSFKQGILLNVSSSLASRVLLCDSFSEIFACKSYPSPARRSPLWLKWTGIQTKSRNEPDVTQESNGTNPTRWLSVGRPVCGYIKLELQRFGRHASKSSNLTSGYSPFSFIQIPDSRLMIGIRTHRSFDNPFNFTTRLFLCPPAKFPGNLNSIHEYI